MNSDKSKKLEAAGWKQTTVQEFLDLSDADMAYIETKLAMTKKTEGIKSGFHHCQ